MTDDKPIASPVPPIDPGDAGGVGNGVERAIAPGTLHEAVEDVPEREAALRDRRAWIHARRR